jgi:ankyrin repeat protein
MVKLLLKKSTDIDRKDAREWTALHWEASKGHGDQWTSAVNILLLNKANVHAKDKSETVK